MSSSGSSKTTGATAAAGGGGGGGGGSGGNTNVSTGSTVAAAAAATGSPKDEAVLEYLKAKGMGSACLELAKILKDETGEDATKQPASLKEDLEQKDEEMRFNRTVLTKSTGGGFGYDRDAAVPIAQWGFPDNLEGAAAATSAAGGKKRSIVLGEQEAKSYLDAFSALQLWILSLPDDMIGGRTNGTNCAGWQPRTVNVIAKAKALIENGDGSVDKMGKNDTTSVGRKALLKEGDNDATVKAEGSKNEDDDAVMTDATQATKEETEMESGEKDDEETEGKEEDAKESEEKEEDKPESKDKGNDTGVKSTEAKEPDVEDNSDGRKKATLAAVITELAKPTEPIPNSAAYPLPPSAKPELLAVSFALLVHTYCELLEAGMEYTAHVLRDAFKPIYEPLYGEQYKDLYFCNTTEDIVRLNTHNSQHMDALSHLKSTLIQIAQIQMKQEELSKMNITNPEQQEQRRKKLQEYNQSIGLLQQRHTEKSQLASQAFDKMYDLPFLRRARAVRWQITLSTTSYGMLCQFLSQTTGGGGLLAMSTLLQTKCELHIEQRDPLPFTPACVLDDNSTSGMGHERYKNLNQIRPIQWAAPVAKSNAKEQEGAVKSERPFPKFQLDDEYEDERAARRGKRSVEFNRALLVNGFRRLEALERKRDFEAISDVGRKILSRTVGKESSSEATEGSEGTTSATNVAVRTVADPLEPSILLSTLCANKVTKERIGGSSSSKNRNRSNSLGGSTGGEKAKKMPSFMWQESGIGITCAKLCPPDGRRVAIGCDDSAIRVWNLLDVDFNRKDTGGGGGGDNSSVGDASQVLLGHKNGFPVYELSWNRDGRTLLSAGGDGSIRLWDTQAQGPFGEVKQSNDITKSAPSSTSLSSNLTKKGTVTSVAAREGMNKAKENLDMTKKHPDMTVPGIKAESRPYTSGTALAVYRGHAQHTPVWSVAFAPCGYYFASAGSDATARLWTTDRPVPVRLFTGHTANSIHTLTWHPNANYVLTGSEDKTCRLWDIQTGRCVRLLNGCPSGIFKVAIDPSGQYATGSDLYGTCHLWDLASGKKVTELRNVSQFSAVPPSSSQHKKLGMNHGLAFSPCGSALATGGDNRCVQIWDIKKAVADPSPVLGVPVKSVPTRRTMIMDLSYTKRNLLLSVGKYIAAIPTVNSEE